MRRGRREEGRGESREGRREEGKEGREKRRRGDESSSDEYIFPSYGYIALSRIKLKRNGEKMNMLEEERESIWDIVSLKGNYNE